MAQVVFDEIVIARLDGIDASIDALNEQKIRVLFGALGIAPAEADFKRMLEWDLILVAVPDRQMAAQLNRLCTYVPNLKFRADADKALFAYEPGKKGRRVWKER
jgi:hypothetical protein